MSKRQPYYVGIKGIIKNSEGDVLILRDSSTGKWEAPGGRMDADQTIEEAFSREIGEEVEGAVLQSLGNVFYVAQGGFTVEDEHKLLLLFYETIVDMPLKIKLSFEHTDFAWVNAKSLADYDIYASDKAAVMKVFNS